MHLPVNLKPSQQQVRLEESRQVRRVRATEWDYLVEGIQVFKVWCPHCLLTKDHTRCGWGAEQNKHTLSSCDAFATDPLLANHCRWWFQGLYEKPQWSIKRGCTECGLPHKVCSKRAPSESTTTDSRPFSNRSECPLPIDTLIHVVVAAYVTDLEFARLLEDWHTKFRQPISTVKPIPLKDLRRDLRYYKLWFSFARGECIEWFEAHGLIRRWARIFALAAKSVLTRTEGVARIVEH